MTLLLQSYSAFIFDFDYTLADSSKGIVYCFRKILNRHSYINISDDSIKRTIGMTLEDSFSQLTGLTDADILTTLKYEYVEEAYKVMNANTVFYDASLPFVTNLKQSGKLTGIVSTKQSHMIREFLVSKDAISYFNVIIGIEDVKYTKPNPEGLLLAIQHLNMPADKVLYLGDSIIDAKTAEAANVDFIAVTTGATLKDEFLRFPHKYIVSSLSELTI
ncbi:HAD family hydrolase [Prevotella sp. 10(H)]|uniref:HAD family hydrolase n=1 Tax=Prevotella sp. 10(H) TaxID=1158294 RepID=UPI0004A721DB|nr:HAD-IA family hydrolase [Prevotella sp. 10(H)]